MADSRFGVHDCIVYDAISGVVFDMSTLAIKSHAIYIQPMETPANPLDGLLCFGVYSTGLAFNRVYKPILDRFGLTYLQYLVLVALREEDDQRVSELGDSLFLESNTLTPLLKRMETAGIVSRQRDNRDERVVRVRLTEAGRALAHEAACIPDEILQATGMTLEQLGEMQSALLRLRATLRSAARTAVTMEHA